MSDMTSHFFVSIADFVVGIKNTWAVKAPVSVFS